MNSEPRDAGKKPSPLRRAEAKLREGDAEEAGRLALEQPGPAAQVFLARLAGRAGDPDAAEQHYRRALEADPGNLAALRALSSMAAAADRGEEAEALLRRWAEADPGDPEHEDMLAELRSDGPKAAEERPLPMAEDLEEVLTRPEAETSSRPDLLEGELMPAPSLSDPDFWDLGDDSLRQSDEKEN